MTPTAISQLNAQFNRTHISELDFKEAEEYLRSLRGKRLMPVQRALLLSAIIAYCRPFTQNETTPNPKATPQLAINAAKELEPDEYLLHTRLLELRHKALAHSEYSRKPTGRVMATATGYMTSSKPFDVLFERIDRKHFQVMCHKLSLYCSAKLFELNRKLGPLA